MSLLCSAALLLSAGCRGRADRMEQDLRDTSSPTQGVAPLALLSPQAGDTLVEGQTYVIRWSAPARPEALVWKIPVGFVTGFGVASSDQVRLRLEDADSPANHVEAGPFTVRGVGRR